MDHECDRQMDGQTAASNSVLTCVLKMTTKMIRWLTRDRVSGYC